MEFSSSRFQNYGQTLYLQTLPTVRRGLSMQSYRRFVLSCLLASLQFAFPTALLS
jgi:hypothetical protein